MCFMICEFGGFCYGLGDGWGCVFDCQGWSLLVLCGWGLMYLL